MKHASNGSPPHPGSASHEPGGSAGGRLEPDRLDAELRRALSAPDGVAECLVQQALQHDADGHPRRAAPRWTSDRARVLASAAALCLLLVWISETFRRPQGALQESPSVHLAQTHPTPPQSTSSPAPPRRHLRLTNEGDVVQLTAPEGNTLLIVVPTPPLRR